MILRLRLSRLYILLLIFLSASTYSNSQLEVGDWDIDDDGRADALTDGLFFLRYTFGLRGDALISGLISSGSEYTTATEIERELALVYDASGDIDGDGNVDALTDGLLLLRYLFGLSGDTLTVGVVASNATRTTASELEGFISNLMPSAPYITLIGSAELAHEQATAYVDAGAVANDYTDGSVEVSVSGSVDSDRAGVYVLTYTAVDSEGNEAKPVTRTVTVADTTPPVITLLGEATVEIDLNASYTDAGATAVDAVDGDHIDGDVELVKTGSVDTASEGTYTITYTATDSSDNSASVSRTVGVISGNFWPKITSNVDIDVESLVSDILENMTLREKIGQMIQAEISAVTKEDVQQYHLGSVLNGGGSWPNGKQSSVSDWVTLADDYFLASTDQTDGSSGIPIIWGTDAVHGHNNVIGATIFPHNIGLGATRDTDLIRRIGEITALEVAVTGIDWVFSPVAAVVRNDRWGRAYEGFSEDPQIVRSYMASMVRGLQGDKATDSLFSPSKVVATAKHFIGDGGTTDGIDQGNTEVSEQELRDIHGQGYMSAIESGVQTIMATFNSWNGSKVHGNNYLLNEVLKEQMGFEGFVIGDWNGHGQVNGCNDEQCAQAINAGVDMIMVPFAWRAFFENTVNQVENGEIAITRINDAVKRILRVKARSGIIGGDRPSERQYSNQINILGSETHRLVAREAVRKSLVLLKNKNSILPLKRNQRILVTGPGANSIGQQSGGWTITWQGTGNSNADFPNGTSVYDGISQVVSDGGGTIILSTDGTYSGSRPDAAIVVYGETPYAEGAGDLSSLEYQSGSKTDLNILKSLKDQGIPIISIFLSGRPLWVNAEINASDAFIAAWLPGSEGIGIADVIFTNNEETINYDFSGKLSFSWPNTPTQFNLNRYDENYNPLFSYGFGLTYQDEDTLGDDLDESGSSDTNQPILHSIPGLIEAEDYSDMFGIQSETTNDDGGGLNVGYVDEGDWIEYSVDVEESGEYSVEYRLASLNGSSGFELLVDGQQVDVQTVPSTGGWQNWVSETSTVSLEAGEQTIRINAIGALWNLNWLKFTQN